jgi:hypothetical protein
MASEMLTALDHMVCATAEENPMSITRQKVVRLRKKAAKIGRIRLQRQEVRADVESSTRRWPRRLLPRARRCIATGTRVNCWLNTLSVQSGGEIRFGLGKGPARGGGLY